MLLLGKLTNLQPGGGSHIKRTGVRVIPFRSLKSSFDTSEGVHPQNVHSAGFDSSCPLTELAI